jgi:hypothetical protein
MPLINLILAVLILLVLGGGIMYLLYRHFSNQISKDVKRKFNRPTKWIDCPGCKDATPRERLKYRCACCGCKGKIETHLYDDCTNR